MHTNKKRLINIKNLNYSVTRNDNELVEIFHNFNFEIFENETIGITGSSGLGKTTLCSIIAKSIPVPKQNLIIAKDLKIRIVSQEDSLLPWMGIFDNIKIGCLHESRNNAEIIVNNLLKKFGLYEVKNEYPITLSGGMKQRASIARALASNPNVLILDESLHAIDKDTKKNVIKILQDYKALGKTLILISHHIGDLISMSKRIIVLSNQKNQSYNEIDIEEAFSDNPRTKSSRCFIDIENKIYALLSE